MSNRTLLLALVSAALIGVQAEAGPLYRVTRVVHGTTGGFSHSLFHTANDDTTSGARLGWFDLDPNSPPGANYYDPGHGILRFEGLLFSDKHLTDQIGVFAAESNNLYGADLSDGVWDDNIVGSITFSLTFFDSSSDFFSYLSSETGVSSGSFISSLNFVDRQYGGVQPLFANSLEYGPGLLTLWGADGAVDGNGEFGPSILGGDIVLALVAAPEPTSVALWSMAGAACWFAARRRRRISA